MKSSISLLVFFLSLTALSQSTKISTVDFVQIQNDNRDEAIFYYENNWLVLRKKALEKDYIDSYDIIEVEASEDAPFHLILKTTYPDQTAYDQAEERFTQLINERGPLKLLNEKKPGDFRKVIFNKEGEHLF